MPELENAYKYCESVTRLHAKSFYFAAKFLPVHKQRAVFPIYAFCRHVDDEIDEIGEINVEDMNDPNTTKVIEAAMKWRNGLNEIYKGNPGYERRLTNDNQIKVFLAWQDVLKTYKINLDYPSQLVEGVLMDTRINRYETFDELYVYCYRVASTVGLMSSEILGYRDKSALRFAEAMGIGMQLTNILRDVKEDAARGRIYLPQEDLRAFDVTEEQILANRFDENLARLMKFEVERARRFYREGERGIELLEKDSRFTVLLASRVYEKILDEIERQNYDVFIRRAHTSKMQKFLSIPKIWLQTR